MAQRGLGTIHMGAGELMRCGNCGSGDTETVIHQERGHYEGTLTCHACGAVVQACADSVGGVIAILGQKR